MHIVHFRMSFSFFERIFSSATEAETTHTFPTTPLNLHMLQQPNTNLDNKQILQFNWIYSTLMRHISFERGLDRPKPANNIQ